ncbi:MAG: DUF1398 domain-containing protein [Pseudomonadota bacterium]|nr:DUF1398 domain-containing protein [Pseudomonadota bacterium]
MNTHSEQLIRDAAQGSSEGRLHFAQVLGMLAEAGVESYLVDYRARRTSYHVEHGAPLELDTPMPDVPIADQWDAAALQAAIRGSQQDIVRYPEFKLLSRRAGCVGYVVWLAGRHVTYFGRRGEQHVERFPD